MEGGGGEGRKVAVYITMLSHLCVQVDKCVNPAQISTLRNKETSLDQMEDIKSALSERSKAQLRAQYGVKEIDNPLFSLEVDLYR